jgi:hypothetical protein
MINSSMSDLYARQATLLQDKFGDFFTYYRDEINSLREV